MPVLLGKIFLMHWAKATVAFRHIAIPAKNLKLGFVPAAPFSVLGRRITPSSGMGLDMVNREKLRFRHITPRTSALIAKNPQCLNELRSGIKLGVAVMFFPMRLVISPALTIVLFLVCQVVSMAMSFYLLPMSLPIGCYSLWMSFAVGSLVASVSLFIVHTLFPWGYTPNASRAEPT
mgnify:CR=1 FL=1